MCYAKIMKTVYELAQPYSCPSRGVAPTHACSRMKQGRIIAADSSRVSEAGTIWHIASHRHSIDLIHLVESIESV